MNVLVVSSKYPPEYSGSGLRAHYTYKRLSSKFGVSYKVVTSSVTTNNSRDYYYENVPVKLIANKIKSNQNGSASFINELKNYFVFWQNYWTEVIPTFQYLMKLRTWFDLIHVFGSVNVTAGAILFSKIMKKPLVVEIVNQVKTPHQNEPRFISKIYGKKYPANSLIVCLSKYQENICRQWNYKPENIWCRPNPIDETRFYYEDDRQQKYRSFWPELDKNDLLLCYLAKFIPLKNQLFLIDLMTLLPEQYKLLLVGPLINSGPLKQRDNQYFHLIIEKIKSLKLGKRVRIIPGFVEHPEKYLKAADVFVMPTTREAFGTPVLESIACGVPVIANDIPGVFDNWIQNSINGYLCPLNHQEWADRIMKASSFDNESMKNASSFILDKASTETIDREYYKRLCSLANCCI